MLIASLLLAALGTISGMAISDMLMNTYESLAHQKLDRGVSACKNYVRSVLVSVSNIARSAPAVSFALSEDVDAPPNLGSSKETAAVSLYSLDGRIYSTDGANGVPTLDELSADPDFNDFFTLELDEFVSLRTHAVTEEYGGKPYDENAGIVSCCHKIYGEDGAVIGFVVADVFPSALYRYFDFSDDDTFGGSVSVIRLNETNYFPFENNSEYLSDFAAVGSMQSRESKDGKYLMMTSPRNFFDGTITVGFSLGNHRFNVIAAISVIVVVCLAAICAVHFAARAFAAHTDKRLCRLLDKMQGSELE